MQYIIRRMVRDRPKPTSFIFRLCTTYQRPSEALTRSAYIHHLRHRRTLINVSPFLLPPLVFSGLVLVLWTWKCFMMIVFQNKIIYMPGLPPNARREKISDYINQCGGITWREARIVSPDRTQIALCIASVESPDVPLKPSSPFPVYILYFQGYCFPCLLTLLVEAHVSQEMHQAYPHDYLFYPPS